MYRLTLMLSLLAMASCGFANEDAPVVLILHYMNARGHEQGTTEIYGLSAEECQRRGEELAEHAPTGLTVTVECAPVDRRRPTRPESRT